MQTLLSGHGPLPRFGVLLLSCVTPMVVGAETDGQPPTFVENQCECQIEDLPNVLEAGQTYNFNLTLVSSTTVTKEYTIKVVGDDAAFDRQCGPVTKIQQNCPSYGSYTLFPGWACSGTLAILVDGKPCKTVTVSTSAASGQPPTSLTKQAASPGADDGEAGRTDPLSVVFEITACRQSLGNWKATITGTIAATYESGAWLAAGQTEVITGAGGNTTQQNFQAQLTSLTVGPGDRPWWKLAATVAHEAVHETHIAPSLAAAVPAMVIEIDKLTTPHASCKIRAQAVAEIKASGKYAVAKINCVSQWFRTYGEQSRPDHGENYDGPSYQAEMPIIDAARQEVRAYAQSQGWN